tara:strand:- start:1506 stop:1865 length:360 start_codon:yes stop_codon:yes gene_type:complete
VVAIEAQEYAAVLDLNEARAFDKGGFWLVEDGLVFTVVSNDCGPVQRNATLATEVGIFVFARLDVVLPWKREAPPVAEPASFFARNFVSVLVAEVVHVIASADLDGLVVGLADCVFAHG